MGSLDFNLNAGPLITQAASLQILNFTSDGTLAGACGTGDVNGQLPAALTFDNGTGFNDNFDNFKFGRTLSFNVSLYGPALSAPDGVSTSGTKFAFSMFSDPAGTVPALTSDLANGFAFTVNVNLDETTTNHCEPLGHCEWRPRTGRSGTDRGGRQLLADDPFCTVAAS